MTEIKTIEDVTDVWDQYEVPVGLYIMKIVGDQDTANDLSHEVLLKLYSSRGSGRKIRNVKSWLFRIAYNTCMDHFKKTTKEVELKVDIPQEEDNLLYKKAGEYIAPLIHLLPKKYGDPLRMSDLGNLKQNEVAAKLGLTISATKSRIQRGRRMLKSKLKHCFHIDFDGEGLSSFRLKSSCDVLQQYTHHSPSLNPSESKTMSCNC